MLPFSSKVIFVLIFPLSIVIDQTFFIINSCPTTCYHGKLKERFTTTLFNACVCVFGGGGGGWGGGDGDNCICHDVCATTPNRVLYFGALSGMSSSNQYLHLSARIFPLGSTCVMIDKVNSSIGFHSFFYRNINSIALADSQGNCLHDKQHWTELFVGSLNW